MKLSGLDRQILKPVDTQQLLEQLLDLAEHFGFEVRHVPLGGSGGGPCRVHGKEVLFVDTQADLADQIARAAAALAQRPGLEDRYLLPQVRDILQLYRQDT